MTHAYPIAEPTPTTVLEEAPRTLRHGLRAALPVLVPTLVLGGAIPDLARRRADDAPRR